MRDPDPTVSGDCADALEKLDPALLAPFKKALLALAATAMPKRVHWHVAQILPRLQLTPRERAAVSEILLEYTHHESALVKTFAMQSLADMALADPHLAKTVVPLIEHLTAHGTAAMRARGRKLLKSLALNTRHLPNSP